MSELQFLGFNGVVIRDSLGLALPIWWSPLDNRCITYQADGQFGALTRDRFDHLAAEGYVTPTHHLSPVTVGSSEAIGLRAFYVTTSFLERTGLELDEVGVSEERIVQGDGFVVACAESQPAGALLDLWATHLLKSAGPALSWLWIDRSRGETVYRLAEDARLCAAAAGNDATLLAGYALELAAARLDDQQERVNRLQASAKHCLRLTPADGARDLEERTEQVMLDALPGAVKQIRRNGDPVNRRPLEIMRRMNKRHLSRVIDALSLLLEYCCGEDEARIQSHELAQGAEKVTLALLDWVANFRLAEILALANKELRPVATAVDPEAVLHDFLVKGETPRALLSWNAFDPKQSSLHTWLFFGARSAFRTYLHEARRDTFQGGYGVRVLDDVDHRTGSTMPTPDPFLRRRIEIALRRLPDDYREVVLLIADGMTPKEAAAKLNIKPGTFRVRYLRARRKLLAELLDLGVDLALVGGNEKVDHHA